MTMTFTRTEHADGRVLSIHMTGVNTAAQSLANAPKLGQRVRETGYSGLIMNYQGCRFDHTVGQFTKVAEALSEALPAHVRVAYVYDESNLMHAAYITRLMKSAGFVTRAFGDFDEALLFAANEKGE
ncbi:MAG: hypothetical protein CMH90_00685 [Oceanicaulis sp.]|uniref:hypothetical protein n=2 Tax=Maricaulaceae TaxID=2800061 RepID=UPI0003B51062|nr:MULTISPECIES: hypothetical protein [Oceanicaulis]MAP47975.1 hypothetical protein [Oceanicaulis sp.]VXC73363.1 conserved hypothetical protein [Oceanicaulis sp. 350]HCR67016.1 hypothetical protein [Oceanicaulis sp.]|tara:strand:+ start:385 stop:765 length:381 start_codon:yes stop_codon:yes gene_type:complete